MKLPTLNYLPVFCFLLFFSNSFSQSAPTYYVDQAAVGVADGSSWDNAFQNLQDVIAVANEGDTVWVAQGIYLPNYDSIPFSLTQDIQIFGGFDGTETNFEDRDPSIYKTILSGDLNEDDVVDDFENNRADNAKTILLFGESITNAMIVDGFIISGGHANGDDSEYDSRRGGGIYAFGIPTIQNCIIEQNYANEAGGGLFFFGGHEHGAKLKKCTIKNNHAAKNGGGIYLAYAEEFDLIIDSCLLANNYAGEEGGALKTHNSECTINASVFQNNKSLLRGGAIEIRAVFDNLKTLITNCIFEKNQARQGGAIRFQVSSGFGADLDELVITGSQFIENHAIELDPDSNNKNQRGGAIHALFRQNTTGAVLALQECDFEKNTTQMHGSALHVELQGPEASVLLDKLNFTENSADSTGTLIIHGSQIAQADIYLEDLTLQNNETGTSNSGIVLTANQFAEINVLATNLLLEENETELLGGGMSLYTRDASKLNLICGFSTFVGNFATDKGGGLFVNAENGNLTARFHHSIFSDNGSNLGAAMALLPAQAGSFIEFDNCIFANHFESSAAIFAEAFPELALYNCTMTANEVYGILLNGNSNLTLQNTILDGVDHATFEPAGAGVTVHSLGNNIFSDDKFDNWLAPNDFASTDPLLDGIDPLEESPAIDAGKLPNNPPFTDYYGNDRVQGGCIDIGAVETAFDSGNGCFVQVEEMALDSPSFSIFPNPVPNELFIELTKNWTENVEIQVVNLMGQAIYFEKFNLNNEEDLIRIDFEYLKSGVYELIVKTEKNIAVKTFIKI